VHRSPSSERIARDADAIGVDAQVERIERIEIAFEQPIDHE